MRCSRSLRVSAQSSPAGMHYTPAPMTLYAHDLEASSIGSRSRSLMEVIRSTGLSTLDARRPIDLGRALQADEPETDSLVGEYLEAAVLEPQLISLVMVAITPQVAGAIRRGCGFRVSDDLANEVCTQLLELLGELPSRPRNERRGWLAATAVKRARSATRKGYAATERTFPLDDGFDIAVASDDAKLKNKRLEAMWAGTCLAVSFEEFVLIEMTRIGKVDLAWAAEQLDVSYDTLRKRRARAEAKLRRFIDEEVGR